MHRISSNNRTQIAAGENRIIVFFVAVCFFLSGAAGLVYEVIWIRLIDKVIGSAPFAVSTVLSVFMAGLALGSYLAGRTVDRFTRRDRLLALYGKMEIGIGICALAVPLMIRSLQPVYEAIYDSLLTHFWCYQAAAFVGCALVLIVPAGLMGATLPVLCRFYVLRLEHIGTRTGWLYGLNTVGAALGVVLCGFVLIKTFGVRMTLGLFGGLNALIGISCLLLCRFTIVDSSWTNLSGTILDSNGDVENEPIGSSGQIHWAVVIFTVSGFCAMAYEVLWTRLLGLIAGPTTYCFTIVVATFIVGLAAGSILFGRLADKTRHALSWLACTQITAAIMALLVSQTLGNGQFFFAKLIHTVQGQFSHLVLIQSMVLFFLLLAPTLFLGAAFPLVNRLCVHSINGMGRSVGTAYALNTVGALTGSLVAGFVLVPWMGKMNGLRLVIAVQFLIAGLILLHQANTKNQTNRPRWPVVGFVAVGLLLLTHYPSWRTDLLSRGWYRDFGVLQADLDRAGWGEALVHGAQRIAGHRQGLEVVFQGEGIGGFTTVEKETTSLGTIEVAMFNSGKADASSHGDRSTQTLSAHIPMLFHADARKVMLLGLASGMTAGEVLLYPVQQLDILEINSAVVTACRKFFYPWNNHCLDDPRTRLIVQDGRNHLALTRESYDVIISEPSNPWMAGLANLYSLEFFQLARRRLTANGIFAQWIQAYEMDWKTFSLLGRTFATVFSTSALIKVGPVDYLMVGFNNNDSRFDWNLAKQNAIIAQKSRIVRFPGVSFLVHLILTEDLQRLFGDGRLHTDNLPFLEFLAPMKLFNNNLDIDQVVADHRRLSPGTKKFSDANNDLETLLDLVEFAASAEVPMFNVLPWARLSESQKSRYRRIVDNYCSHVLIPSYGIFDDRELKHQCADIQVNAINKKISGGSANVMDHYNLALANIAAGQNKAAIDNLHTVIILDPVHEPAMVTLGLMLAETGSLDEAARILSKAVQLAPQKVEPYKYLGMVELRKGTLECAVSNLSAALSIDPDDCVILSELGTAYLLQGKNRKAVTYLSEALRKNSRDNQSRYYLKMAKQKLEAGERNFSDE
ncbi:fused MFS/spermidine synthase [uncultured Desulfosarcina sp.]|uniref:fused MFS/spermidine synthase n=1 Tax=uncultured Desulfosarcina sp. TaxID=218289 RepID=UPI0029C94D2D|nr:fused MFS/spermidine synthase [uncultured Desulfosarcina sp.]